MKLWCYCLVLSLLAGLTHCSEIVERDISRDSVVVIAPVNHFSTTNREVLFWWEPLNGARNYKLEVVSPSFDTVVFLHVDTLTSSEKFKKVFISGRYQWRIKATNEGYETVFIKRNFVVK